MKRYITLLAALGALVALAIPASSTASMFPAGHKFEITGNVNTPKIFTGLPGACSISKIQGQIPPAPQNEEAEFFMIPTPTVSGCSSTVLLTLSGEWKFYPRAFEPVLIAANPGQIVIRNSSFLGCKMTNTGGVALSGIWSNGVNTPHFQQSAYHAHSGFPLTWVNDNGNCALNGKTEMVTWGEQPTGQFSTIGKTAVVNDLTNPAALITLGPKK